jgi:altronate hydrolase
MRDFARDYAACSEAKPTAFVDGKQRAVFQGFRRPSGKAGTRNYIAVLTSVNCSATVARQIARAFDGKAMEAYPNVDGVVAFVHGTGCGMAGSGEGIDTLRRTLMGYARHPNVGAVLMVGLGCEVNEIRRMSDIDPARSNQTLRTFDIQDAGGTKRAVDKGVEILQAMLPAANAARREPVPASELVLGLQCGGSDGYSGISANPALGAAADLLVRHGGTAILSETPEIYGAEHLLIRRASTPEVAENLLRRIRWWEDYTRRNGGEMNNNPSPGNKAGGLTTILEKSLGAAAKGGTTNLNGVYEYAEPITERGFVFMDSPGYDPCSATGQVASGANIISFTTGRGSVFGCKPAPSLKLATNSELYRRMPDDMDIDCGGILDGRMTVEAAGEAIFRRLLEVASGARTKSEEAGIGDDEFVPWQLGAVM